MNAAARFASHNVVSRGWAISLFWARAQMMTMICLIAVLTSALSMVYVTNSSRSLGAAYQQALAERDQLHMQWGQLLLEKSTWVVQARVQQVAEDKLGMVVPTGKSVVIVSSK